MLPVWDGVLTAETSKGSEDRLLVLGERPGRPLGGRREAGLRKACRAHRGGSHWSRALEHTGHRTTICIQPARPRGVPSTLPCGAGSVLRVSWAGRPHTQCRDPQDSSNRMEPPGLPLPMAARRAFNRLRLLWLGKQHGLAGSHSPRSPPARSEGFCRQDPLPGWGHGGQRGPWWPEGSMVAGRGHGNRRGPHTRTRWTATSAAHGCRLGLPSCP